MAGHRSGHADHDPLLFFRGGHPFGRSDGKKPLPVGVIDQRILGSSFRQIVRADSR
jgi:hypothetical protein